MRPFISMFAHFRPFWTPARPASHSVGGVPPPRAFQASQSTRLLFFAALLVALIAGTTVRAQAVRWDPPSGQLGYNQVSELALVFEGCEPELDLLRLPNVDGLVMGRPSTKSNSFLQLGSGGVQSASTFSLVFPVRPSKRTTISIPAFTVQTDKGALRVAAATYTVSDASAGNSGLSVEDISSVTLVAPKTTFWAGEVFPLTYNLSVIRRYFHSPASNIDWQSAPLIVEPWSQPEPTEAMMRGERRVIVTQNTRAYAKDPGTISLKPAQQLVNLIVGTSGFGLFATPAVEQRVLSTQPLELTIKPRPAAPADFSGAVGQFALVSKVVPTAPAVGEPVTWTLELTGTGNWPDIAGLPQREVSADFSVVQPKSKRTMKDNSLFDGTLTEDVVLVPTKPGRYTLPPIRFTYFDTASGTYKTITTEPVTLQIGPGAAAPTQTQPTGPVQFSLSPQGSSAAAATTPLPEAVPPVPPENLPRDPLTESRRGFAPLHADRLVVLSLLSSVLGPLLLWLFLAAQRARALDPERRRREAHAALAQLLREIGAGTSPSALRPRLQQWQHLAAILWRIPHAAPGAPLVHQAVASSITADAAPSGDAALPGGAAPPPRSSRSSRGEGTPAPAATAADTWAALWNEADRAQHGRDTVLPADWPVRAAAALAAVKVPGWPVSSLFAPRHLFPSFASTRIAALLAVLLSLSAFSPSAFGAESALETYRRGDFTAAEKNWRETLRAAPTDWTARHNLGLALAQQDRWAEATAQWTSAFLLAARENLTRYDLVLGLQRSGLAPPELVALSRGEGRYALARVAAPGEWQWLLVGAALLLALAFALLLLAGYRKLGGWARIVALVVLVGALLLAGTSTLALHTYGQLAHPDAVIVVRASTLRSIPTDADTQKVSALSAGSIATVDKTFLGWSRLQFPGGQTGWARTADLVALYR